jgi:hypothetical protein
VSHLIVDGSTLTPSSVKVAVRPEPSMICNSPIYSPPSKYHFPLAVSFAQEGGHAFALHTYP